jgi:hypothetical protein
VTGGKGKRKGEKGQRIPFFWRSMTSSPAFLLKEKGEVRRKNQILLYGILCVMRR